MTQLQRLAGNQAVQRRVGDVQRQVAPPVTGAVLQSGARGAPVLDLQQKLNGLGTRPRLSVDGVFGRLTKGAVQRFQGAHTADGLAVTGRVDDATRRVLGTVREIDATENDLGRRIAEDMSLANQQGTATSGLYYAENYRRRFGSTPMGRSLTADDYAQGHADPAYFDRLGYWDWQLKPRRSAAEAVRAFLRGLTIAECNSIAVAIHLDAVRAAVGDHRFDEMFGSAGRDVPAARRLRISPYTSGQHPSAERFLTHTAAAGGAGGTGTIGHRPVHVGEWYYFGNHPAYRQKHPTGSWQGENAIFLGVRGGEQRWSGFGAENVNERYMLNKLVEYYNKPAPGWTGSPATITAATLIAGGGGLRLGTGLKLDADLVRASR